MNLLDKKTNKKGLSDYSYNKILIFKYSLKLNKSQFILDIYANNTKKSHFNKVVLGSFVYDISVKHSISEITINSKNKLDIEALVFGIKQKDFIFSKYKNNSKSFKFNTTYKLSNNYNILLNSINFLKELVSEPSNIIYPSSFVKRTIKQISKDNININILNKKNIEKIGLNCVLAVSQGSQREPKVMEFSKKNTKKNVDILFVGKGVCFDSGGISIKPSAGMEDMKWDMAGSAVTVSIIKYLSEIKTNFSYAGIVGLVENMPSGTAYKPGDIIKSYKGINDALVESNDSTVAISALR